jgi:ABC-type nitrate/sulfonate/bicarbonate transport system permease component
MVTTVSGTARSPAARPAVHWPLSRSTTVSIVAVLVFLALWQLAPAYGLVNGRLTSQPSGVLAAGFDAISNGSFWFHARVSLVEFVFGFALALLMSVPLGLLLATSRYARYLLEPPLMTLYMAPSMVLLPILVIGLGIGIASKVAVVFLGAIFPIVINTMAGVREADYRLVRVASSFGANKLDAFLRILIPGALPQILMGIRLAVGRGVLGVVVGELYVSEAGIGHQLSTYGNAMRIDLLLVYAVAICIFGYTMTSLVGYLETSVRTWRTQ